MPREQVIAALENEPNSVGRSLIYTAYSALRFSPRQLDQRRTIPVLEREIEAARMYGLPLAVFRFFDLLHANMTQTDDSGLDSRAFTALLRNPELLFGSTTGTIIAFGNVLDRYGESEWRQVGETVDGDHREPPDSHFALLGLPVNLTNNSNLGEYYVRHLISKYFETAHDLASRHLGPRQECVNIGFAARKAALDCLIPAYDRYDVLRFFPDPDGGILSKAKLSRMPVTG